MKCSEDGFVTCVKDTMIGEATNSVDLFVLKRLGPYPRILFGFSLCPLGNPASNSHATAAFLGSLAFVGLCTFFLSLIRDDADPRLLISSIGLGATSPSIKGLDLL